MKKKPTESDQSSRMDMFDDKEIGLALNNEPRCPCVLSLDCSGSMSGRPIAQVEAGLHTLKESLLKDPIACLRVELAVITFNDDVKVVTDFCSPDQFSPPSISATGATRLGAAVKQAIHLLESRCAEYRAAGTAYYRPWLLVLSDGKATDSISDAAQLVKDSEVKRKIAFFAIGVQGANMEDLAQLSARPPRALDGLKFDDLFEWLSVNLSSVAASHPGDQVPLTQPSWGAV